MAQLQSNHREALRTSVYDALHTVSDSSALRDAIAAVRTTVETDIAAIARTWNGQHKDALRRLPLEVHVACLSWLTIDEVLATSHVSRDWRAIALSEPLLWTQFDTAPFRNIEAAFEAVVSRVRSAPFDVLWSTNVRMSPRVREMLVEHSSHLRSLVFTAYRAPTELLSTLLELPMPCLCVLEAESMDDVLQLPDSFSNQPRLRSLTLEEVLLPTQIHAVSSVRALTLSAPPDCRRLFDMFPRVQTVVLTDVTTGTLLPRKLVQSLLSMDISGGNDHSLFLQNLEWHRIPRMRIESTCVSRPLDWFVTGAWGITITSYPAIREVDVALDAKDADAMLHFSIHFGDLRADISNWTANVTTLALIGVESSLSLLSGRAFPSLLSFTMGFDNTEMPLSWRQAAGQTQIQPLSVPLLQDLNLNFTKYAYKTGCWGVAQEVQAVSEILALGHRRLNTIRLIGTSITQSELANLSSTKALCDTLRLDWTHFAWIEKADEHLAETTGPGGL